MAIEKLTKENLIKHGFDEKTINRFFKNESYVIQYNNFFATEIENKIYSGIDFYKWFYFAKDKKPSFPKYCIELLPEYVNLSFDYLIKKEIEKGNKIYFEQKIKQRFIDNQIQYCNDEIEKLNKTNLRHIVERTLDNLQNALDWFEDYKTNKLIQSFEKTEQINKLIESKLSDDNHLAVKITGYGNQNINIKEQPVFYYIEDILKENNLTPIEAIKIVEKMKGSFSPNFNKVVTPKIVEHLESLNKYYIPEVKKTTNNKRLKVNQIALIHIYNNEIINRDNAKIIAEKNGYKSKTSGEGLFQDFCFYSSKSNRRGKSNPYTVKKMKNKIELFKSVIPFVKVHKEMLLDEIKTLETLLEKHND